MAFKYKKSLNPNSGPVLISIPVTTTVTIDVGDAVEIDTTTTRYLAPCAAAVKVLGHVHALVQPNGLPLTASTGAVDRLTYTTTSSGEIYALVDVSKMSLYSAEMSAALGTTGTTPYYENYDLSDETKLDEATAAATSAQYKGWGVDPDDSARLLVTIKESELD